MEIDSDEEEILFEDSLKMALEMCGEFGHNLTRVIADNGFTYDIICGRCGSDI